MSIDLDMVMREQLVERRQRVAAALSTAGADPQLTALLREVDAALERFESGFRSPNIQLSSQQRHSTQVHSGRT